MCVRSAQHAKEQKHNTTGIPDAASIWPRRHLKHQVSNKADRNSYYKCDGDWLFGRGLAVTAQLIHLNMYVGSRNDTLTARHSGTPIVSLWT